MKMPVDTITAVLSAIIQGLQYRVTSHCRTTDEEEKRNNAIGEVMNAAAATKAYLYDTRKLGKTSREKENQISQAWQKAATAIKAYDQNLYFSSQVKSLGWADPREWKTAKNKATTVNLDKIIEQCEWLRTQR
jgi:hypothetical protein